MTATDSLIFRATVSHGRRSVGLVEGGEGGLGSLVVDDCHKKPTFRATESHDERSIGLVEGGERGLASFVTDGCHR
jgi:hypothetical protein